MHIDQFLDAVEFDADGLMEYESFIDMLFDGTEEAGDNCEINAEAGSAAEEKFQAAVDPEAEV